MKRLIVLILIGMGLGLYAGATCTIVDETYAQTNLADFSPLTTDNVNVWGYDSRYGAKAMNRDGAVGYLITPSLDFTDAESVNISFKHAHKFAADPSSELTLYVSTDYNGDVSAATWTPLTIAPYASNTDWTFVSVSIDVPLTAVGQNTVFAFRYMSTATAYATWEVKDIHITSTCPSGPIVIESPVPVPNVGTARLKVAAQNLRNYYYNYQTNDRPEYSDAAGFADKTHKIVNAMHMLDADIYAFCELEAQEIILQQLADSMNVGVEGAPFRNVTDFIDVPNSERTNNIKSGFIYRSDKVRPVGNNMAGSTAYYYRETMRIQLFEELSSGQRFVLSMNHFKAKDNTEDAGDSKRVANANSLVSALNSYAADPDILIMGDLNCTVSEQPLTIIANAGYAEQLLRFDPNAISHCWNWSGELIDHVFANPSMAAQITGAGMFPICTSCSDYWAENANYRYSDHDPYMVGINLVAASSAVETQPEMRTQVRKVLMNGHLYVVLPDGTCYTATGLRIE